ncbi:histidine phosphatase family protein [Streptomyces sp. NBC_01190]|uniref:histidine phosphatase family protein n=1 Tax=Streptomyces sp. NBC_01190 TaxID=2903767 RepID=UPI0038656010|nr:histidine phosphatase family protein [Streptomyces sp. NBC_01190]
MSVTYLVRHAQTSYSSRYLVNGSLDVDVRLDPQGAAACRDFTAPWAAGVRSCRTSGFRRTQQTAELLLAGRPVPRTADHRLDEVDYGRFEGGPWTDYGAWLVACGLDAVPPGGQESWRDCVRRMLEGLLACLDLPGPRLVVGHGLLGSVARWLQLPEQHLDAPVFPEAPYLEPLVLSDEALRELVAKGARILNGRPQAVPS